MSIESIKGNHEIYKANEQKIVEKLQQERVMEEAKKAPVQDKLELSGEAMKLAPIKAKMDSGFYDNPDVLRQVAKKLSYEIK